MRNEALVHGVEGEQALRRWQRCRVPAMALEVFLVLTAATVLASRVALVPPRPALAAPVLNVAAVLDHGPRLRPQVLEASRHTSHLCPRRAPAMRTTRLALGVQRLIGRLRGALLTGAVQRLAAAVRTQRDRAASDHRAAMNACLVRPVVTMQARAMTTGAPTSDGGGGARLGVTKINLRMMIFFNA